MAETIVEILKNGPIYIEGEFKIIDHDGADIPLRKEGKAVLCRCGASSDKPFCDGTHSQIGFAAAAAANPASAE